MRYKNVKRLIRIRPLHSLMQASKRIIIPGFEGENLYVVSKFFLDGLRNGTLNMRATSLSYSFFLALFPTIIFLFTLIPYIPIPNFQGYIFNLMQSVLPQSAFAAAEETIIDIIKKPRGGLLSIGFVSALYFSTNGFNAMINAFNETYHSIETRKPLHQRFISLIMVLVTVIMLIVAIILIILSEIGFHKIIHEGQGVYYTLLIGKYLILVFLCLFIISFNYFMGPKRKNGFTFFSAGSIFATVLIGISSYAFAYYVNNFSKYNKLYGSIGTLLVIMLWIYIISLILLLGFDLNASIHSAKHRKGKTIKRV